MVPAAETGAYCDVVGGQAALPPPSNGPTGPADGVAVTAATQEGATAAVVVDETAAAVVVDETAAAAVVNKGPGKRSLRAREAVNYNEEHLLRINVTHEDDDRAAKRQRMGQQGRRADEGPPKSDALEMETAWAVNYNGQGLIDEEEGLLPPGADEATYVWARNKVLTMWREDVSQWLPEVRAVEGLRPRERPYGRLAWRFLTAKGVINAGVGGLLRQHDRPITEHSKSVVVVGAGLAGLAAARQLRAFGFKVVVLEGHSRPGGRVYSRKLESHGFAGVADLGGSIITGVNGNPLALLAKQMGVPLYDIGDTCPLYYSTGKQPGKRLDEEVYTKFNEVLDKAGELRDDMGDLADSLSVGSALEALAADFLQLEDPGVRALFHWHTANLEFANAQTVWRLSMRSWDQDDPYEFQGAHCWMPGGNLRLIAGLAEGLPVFYNSVVKRIRYHQQGVEVDTDTHSFQADAVVVTVPLGVLKKGVIAFEPPLPQRKQEVIQRLGFGLLNKVVLLFPRRFWGESMDLFGYVHDDPSERGLFFLFYQYDGISGAPVLAALVAGQAAAQVECMDKGQAVQRVMGVLRTIFRRKGVKVPPPLQAVVTAWGKDPMSYGSYSSMAVGCLGGEDYDIMAENLGGRVFFAGEATTKKYPATMHGAYISGLREAANVAATLTRHADLAARKGKQQRKAAQDAVSEAATAAAAAAAAAEEEAQAAAANGVTAADADEAAHEATGLARRLQALFDDEEHPPDVEFGCFSALFGPQGGAHEGDALLRLDLGDAAKGGARTNVPMYIPLSRATVERLRDIPGGDDARINHLVAAVGARLVGRQGLPQPALQLVDAICVARGQPPCSGAQGQTQAAQGGQQGQAQAVPGAQGGQQGQAQALPGDAAQQ